MGRFKSPRIALGAIAALALAGCGKPRVELTEADRSLAAEMDLPEAFLLQMKGLGQHLRQLEGTDAQGEVKKAKGVTIDVPQEKAAEIVRRLQEHLPAGWLAFVSDRNFGIGGKPDHVSALKAASIPEVLAAMGTNGWNYDLSPETVIARIKDWDGRFGLILRGAGLDWLEASFKRQPPNMLEFAREVYKFCPDVVDQGTETVEALAAEMRRTNTLYLWWD